MSRYFSQKCNLAGVWENELGSQVAISKVDTDGLLTGSYNTAVSVSGKPVSTSPLSGYQQKSDQNPGGPTFGFTVNWTSTETTTAFAGQCFMDQNGKEVLKTMWLLRDRVEGATEDWKATRVGTNVFARVGHR
ncbi:avidin-like [Ambystoma mexicanum]|uniref:avidin-like n=1 Tax=Ambystoma mexicanum TaxID=8296 RepID=UPI0037E78681